MRPEAIDDAVVADMLNRPMPALRRLLTGLRELPSGAPAITESFGREDPRDFMRDILGIVPTAAALRHGYTDGWVPEQERVLLSVRDFGSTLVPSGRGVGKTWIAAAIVLWFLYSNEDSIVVTTARDARQVEVALWGEIRKLWLNSKVKLPGRLLQTKLEIAEKWLAIGFTAVPSKGDLTATGFQSLHGKRVLMVYDEAVGIPEEIKTAGDGIAVGPNDRHLAFANPTDPISWFVKAMREPRWNVVHLNCHNHPNVIHDDPEIVLGAVSRKWISDRLQDFGSTESPLYQSQVLGVPPTQSSDSLISYGWIEAAQQKWDKPVEEDDRRGVAVGIDVAGEGGDLTVAFAIQQGRAFLPDLKGRRAWHQGRDLEHAVDLALALVQEYNVRAMAIDDTGIGQGLTARLRRMQTDGKLPKFYLGPTDKPGGTPQQREMWILGINFGSSADDPTFSLIKDQLWWQAREALRNGDIALPTDREMAKYALPSDANFRDQLTAPLYDAAGPGGKVRVYDKRGAHGAAEKTRTLPSSSPDLAHAFMLSVHAWRRLKPAAPQPARTSEELFEQKTRALMERGQREERDRRNIARSGQGATMAPWRRSS